MKTQKKEHYKPIITHITKQYNDLLKQYISLGYNKKSAEKEVEKLICSNKNHFANFINQIQIKTLKDNNDGKIIHYFIQENSLIDFLMNTEVKDYESIFNYISSVGTLCDDGAIENNINIWYSVYEPFNFTIAFSKRKYNKFLKNGEL